MYQSQWGLAKSPFPSGLTPELFYEGMHEREALARLRFLTDYRRRMGLVLGQSGLGKSQLLQVFALERRRQGNDVALIDLLGLSAREFFWQLGNELNASVRIEDEPLRLFRQLTDRLHENQMQEKRTILLLDNIVEARPDLQTHLIRLARHKVAGAGGLTLVLTASATQSALLQDGLLELVDLRIDLDAWDELDTTGYLQHAMVEAGSEQPMFTDSAINELHRLSQGIPRHVNRLAEHALLLGSQNPGQMIDPETVRAAHQSLSLPGSS
ncbi:MAG: AAA family ATPase [Pirellulales bacterium]|nr:AAA family ATPase [Pirellulales bacterium]